MQAGPKPQFLKKSVAYYVTGGERWRYADTLEGVTSQTRAYFLDSRSNPTDVLASGALLSRQLMGGLDHYVYDPRDTSGAELESSIDPKSLTDQRMIYAHRGKQLIYHSAPFETNTEISG